MVSIEALHVLPWSVSKIEMQPSQYCQRRIRSKGDFKAFKSHVHCLNLSIRRDYMSLKDERNRDFSSSVTIYSSNISLTPMLLPLRIPWALWSFEAGIPSTVSCSAQRTNAQTQNSQAGRALRDHLVRLFSNCRTQDGGSLEKLH